MPPTAILTALRRKFGIAKPGIWKFARIRQIECIGRSGAMSRAAAADAPVEDHVQVLVGGHPLEQLVGDRLVARLAGVAVRHPGGELLERHVDERIQHRLGPDRALTLLAGLKPAVTCSILARSRATGSTALVTTR